MGAGELQDHHNRIIGPAQPGRGQRPIGSALETVLPSPGCGRGVHSMLNYLSCPLLPRIFSMNLSKMQTLQVFQHR